MEKMKKQECIPVGCVPAAHWPYAGVCFWRGGSPWGRGCLFPRGYVSAPVGICSWGVVCSQEVSAPGGCLLPADTPRVNRITDTSKNITLATTSLRLVKKPASKCYLQWGLNWGPVCFWSELSLQVMNGDVHVVIRWSLWGSYVCFTTTSLDTYDTSLLLRLCTTCRVPNYCYYWLTPS